MSSNKRVGRISGILFLLIFIIGITIYQFLRGPIVFSDDFLTATSLNSNQVISSTILGFLSGTLSIVIAIILLPIFKQFSPKLGYIYLSFCILNFVAILIENYSVLSLLELSNEYVKVGSDDSSFFQNIGTIFYKSHKWAHYIYLLVSCLPVFILYYTLLYSKLIPKAISIFGLVATVLMCVEILFSIFEVSINFNLLIPMGLIQLFLPIWLIIKGLNTQIEN